MDNPYQAIRGTPHPEVALGRNKAIGEVIEQLRTKHVSMVGPGRIGKSCMIREIAARVSCEEIFDDVVLWDMKHLSPESDEEFYADLALALGKQIRSEDDAAQYFSKDSNRSCKKILEFFDFIAELEKRVLIILDGMDDPLGSGEISETVWNNMCSLGDKSSATFLTTSRKRPYELCDTKTKGSYFWTRLKNPIELGALDDTEIKEFVAPLIGISGEVKPGTEKEIQNWTGGIPVLLLALCDRLNETARKDSLSPELVNELAVGCIEELEDDLSSIWDQCSSTAQLAYQRLLSDGGVLSSESGDDGKELVLRGLVVRDGNKLKLAARMVQKFCAAKGQGRLVLQELFGTNERFSENIQNLVRMRFAQLIDLEDDFRDFLENAIENMQKPKVCITAIRSITNHCLDEILAVEAPSGDVPKFEMDRPLTGKIGGSREFQCRILDLLTDDRNGVTPKKVNKKISSLINFLKRVGDCGQHLKKGMAFEPSFAASVCMTAIQLAEEMRDAELLG